MMISTGSDKKRRLFASGQGWLRASRFDAHLDLAFSDIRAASSPIGLYRSLTSCGLCIPVGRDEL
jgi:hypothetical protein